MVYGALTPVNMILISLGSNNYRELLASAEQIVLLEVQTKKAETHISEIGRGCQPPLAPGRQRPNNPRSRIVVQLRLLKACLSEARTALRRSDVLQCAQLFVIARILTKSLVGENIPAVAPLQSKVASLRISLLRSADSKLTSPLTEASEMVNACCAYCLVTSSSSIEALKHVQRLRLDRVRSLLSPELLHQQVLVDALRYYLDSLQVLKGLAGRSLLDVLGNLQKRPILEDQSLDNAELLDLRSVRALLPDEIRSFMPYFKRTPLAPSETSQMLNSWSDEVRQTFSSGLARQLRSITSCSDFLQLRQQLYLVFLPVYFRLLGSMTYTKP